MGGSYWAPHENITAASAAANNIQALTMRAKRGCPIRSGEIMLSEGRGVRVARCKRNTRGWHHRQRPEGQRGKGIGVQPSRRTCGERLRPPSKTLGADTRFDSSSHYHAVRSSVGADVKLEQWHREVCIQQARTRWKTRRGSMFKSLASTSQRPRDETYYFRSPMHKMQHCRTAATRFLRPRGDDAAQDLVPHHLPSMRWPLPSRILPRSVLPCMTAPAVAPPSIAPL